jgi:hypothetical protein
MTFRVRRTWPLVVCAAAAITFVLLLPDGACALETQLAGMRLGDHATHLMDVHGVPDVVAVGTGAEAAAAETGGVGGPGVAVAGGPAFPSPLGGGVRAPTTFSGGGGGGGDEEEEEEDSGDEEEEEDGGGGGGGGGGAGSGGVFPTWALPLWVTLRAGETEWVYNGSRNPKHKSPVVMGFVLDRDGFITLISIAGKKCSYAATAGNNPGKRIVLGDEFEDILRRYQWPDEFITFSAAGDTVAQPFTGQIAVAFAEGGSIVSRDLILRYRERSNVAFTLHNMKVTRIHIWSSE